VLVADTEDRGQRVRFDIGDDGKLTERMDAGPTYFFDAAFIPKDEKMKTSLGRWTLALSPYQASPALVAGARSLVDVPDPFAGISPKGSLADFDGNGRPDAYRWVHCDTDQDGSFDLVLFSTRPDSGVAEKAFRIEGDKVRVDSEVASGKLYRSSSLFKDRAAAAGFKAQATEFLPANAVQD
jgi:hypothetical protein